MKKTINLHNGFKLTLEVDVDLDIQFNSSKGFSLTIESPEGDESTCHIHPNEMEVIKNMFDSVKLDLIEV